MTHQQIPSSIMAGVFESVVGTCISTGGQSPVQSFVERSMASVLDREAEPQLTRNYKSCCSRCRRNSSAPLPCITCSTRRVPITRSASESPRPSDHSFYAAAWGASRRRRNSVRALNALCEIEGKPLPHVAD